MTAETQVFRVWTGPCSVQHFADKLAGAVRSSAR